MTMKTTQTVCQFGFAAAHTIAVGWTALCRRVWRAYLEMGFAVGRKITRPSRARMCVAVKYAGLRGKRRLLY